MCVDHLMAAAASFPMDGSRSQSQPAAGRGGLQPNGPHGGGEPMLAERRACAESLDDNYAQSQQQRPVNPVSNIRRPRGRVFTSKRHQ